MAHQRLALFLSSFLFLFASLGCDESSPGNPIVLSRPTMEMEMEMGMEMDAGQDILEVRCRPDEFVRDNICTPCPAGTTSASGAVASGEDTACDPTLCEGDEHVIGNLCTPCAPGTSNPSGDDASGPDTSCTAILCAAGERVSNHTCVECDPGTTNDEGEDSSGEDTACMSCPAGTFDTGENACLPCNPGSISATGATKCEICEAGTYQADQICMACPPDFVSEAGAIRCDIERVDSHLSRRDYSYLYWPGNHWYTWNNYEAVRHIQTGYYGLALDVTRGNFDRMGSFGTESTAEGSLQAENTRITDLPNASMRYFVVDGGSVENASGFYGTGGDAGNPSALVDMGRFMQRIEIPEVTYGTAASLSGALHLAAMPRHFVLTHRVTRSTGTASLGIGIELSGDAISQYGTTQWLDGTRALSITDTSGEGWVFIVADRAGMTSEITRNSDGGLSFESTVVQSTSSANAAISIIAVPSSAATEDQLAIWLRPTEAATVSYSQLNRDGTGGTTLQEATWDTERGLYLIPLGNLRDVGAPGQPDWTDPAMHNWYNRHRIVIENKGTGPVSVPLAFDGGGNAAFYIVGGSPMLRDTDGEPTGVPMQISKNWHDGPHWYHLYTTLELPPGIHEYEHTFAHSKWGEAYAAAHSQLSLVGWGRNQQWDESSLGAFGETITYDPDLTLGRSMVDDVRPFLVDTAGKWRWTGNVGGANFLLYANATTDNRPEHQLGRLRTHYRYTGPNLTDVIYAGVTRDGKIEAEISTQLGRTDDLVRVYYHLHYRFLADVDYDRLAFFQMAADRYGDNGFTRYAYGNAAGVVSDTAVPDHGTTGYAADTDRGIALAGDAPWVMLYESNKSDGNLPEHLANVAFVVRSYEAQIGSTTITTPHINIYRTRNGGISQMSFELGLPDDPNARTIPAGSVVTATVEYLVTPSDKTTYYGASDYLTAMPANLYQSTAMAIALADANQLDVTASIGSVARVHPPELEAVSEATAVQFELTAGLGYTPVTIRGLPRPDGWRLEKNVNGTWERVTQAVEGNDYWQAYDDASSGSFDLIFNLQNRSTNEFRLVR